MTRTNPKILLIDSYDSYTFNLAHLISISTSAQIITIHNDSLPQKSLSKYLSLFDAIVVGPGPGTPKNPLDVGIINELWKVGGDVPVLGVCLGFQSMVLNHGGEVKELGQPKHGLVYEVHHNGQDIYQGIIDGVRCVRYHSLYAIIPDNCDDLEPLGWTFDNDSQNDSRFILMAAKHKSKPLWGVQYHPESICSEDGDLLMKNFWRMAQEWNIKTSRILEESDLILTDLTSNYAIRPTHLLQLQDSKKCVSNFHHQVLQLGDKKVSNSPVVAICDNLRKRDIDFVLLNSAASPSRWSIIGCPNRGKSLVFQHSTLTPNKLRTFPWTSPCSLEDITQDVVYTTHELSSNGGVWEFIASHMRPFIENYQTISHKYQYPFIGGLIGYISYEEGQKYAQSPLLKQRVSSDKFMPDTNLVFITRTILYDSQLNQLILISLEQDDEAWVLKTSNLLTELSKNNFAGNEAYSVPSSISHSIQESKRNQIKFNLPDKQQYISQIKQAKEYLHHGESYELCLTTQATISFPTKIDPWILYKILRDRNPAPYSTFLPLPNASLVGSSPERFLSWDNKTKKCELRPIKGTVKNSKEMTLEKATKLLNIPKEIAENLMIVDLIRHDLYELLSNVKCEKLMVVEEYETVYQLVSVIQGLLDDQAGYKGIDVLAHSLPPGSMTGAPKRRSVEILHELEQYNRRGIYSGVCGYWSVSDDGDWSVVIRSSFCYNDEKENNSSDGQIWRIGAGGAITVLSDEEAEWDEMITKLESALKAFI